MGGGRKYVCACAEGEVRMYMARKFYSRLEYTALDCQGYHVIQQYSTFSSDRHRVTGTGFPKWGHYTCAHQQPSPWRLIKLGLLFLIICSTLYS